MRSLTEEEAKTVFEKLAVYVGRNISLIVDDAEDPHSFVVQKNRVFYARRRLEKLSTNFARKNLMSVGTCIGKFTNHGKFILHITALDLISKYAKYKLWVKPNGEMPFLYGNNIVKAHIGKMSDDIPEHTGVVIYSMNDTPLGFGLTARATAEVRALDPTTLVALRQADIGEYLRSEETLFVT
ncbi:hypothetical protein CANCADRAFT_29878 [Tortispora caseinolytica NRRL Y-17796]|uniref:60S ribosome subunit biogenesis protein NIP7 n=1 Tax=Tortispora caseinolytica NRRL Y-17796 TaxID=767744 RepID=A0A1E4TI88_9ASCO|nr:hypothetical protein CANCADRAFT_29878 [Tortispora caseinolytica NRRL Y-17796]